jgi:hypothetical protein
VERAAGAQGGRGWRRCLPQQPAVAALTQAAWCAAAVLCCGHRQALHKNARWTLRHGSPQPLPLAFACVRASPAQVLQVCHNAFEELPITLLDLSSLTYLDISYNRLTSLPFWIGSPRLRGLRRLNLVCVRARVRACAHAWGSVLACAAAPSALVATRVPAAPIACPGERSRCVSVRLHCTDAAPAPPAHAPRCPWPWPSPRRPRTT